MIIDPVTVTLSRHQLAALLQAARRHEVEVSKRLKTKSLHRHERDDLVALQGSLEGAIDRVADALHRPRVATVDKKD
jgi:hypothetical protein